MFAHVLKSMDGLYFSLRPKSFQGTELQLVIVLEESSQMTNLGGKIGLQQTAMFALLFYTKIVEVWVIGF